MFLLKGKLLILFTSVITVCSMNNTGLIHVRTKCVVISCCASCKENMNIFQTCIICRSVSPISALQSIINNIVDGQVLSGLGGRGLSATYIQVLKYWVKRLKIYVFVNVIAVFNSENTKLAAVQIFVVLSEKCNSYAPQNSYWYVVIFIKKKTK